MTGIPGPERDAMFRSKTQSSFHLKGSDPPPFLDELQPTVAIPRVSTLLLFKVSVVVGVEPFGEVPSFPADVTTSTTLRPQLDHNSTTLRPQFLATRDQKLSPSRHLSIRTHHQAIQNCHQAGT